MTGQKTLYLSLIIATVAVSWASIFIKMSGAGPIPAAFYRMAIASVILAGPAIRNFKSSHRLLDFKEKLLMVISGLVLGLHFATWVTSLFYTTISNSVILVATQPIWVLFMERLFFKTKITFTAVTGTFIALAGMILIAHGDFDLGREFIIGDLLALAGALFAGIYLIIGRRLRTKLNNVNYIFPVYTVAALLLLFIGLVKNENMTDFSSFTWIMFVLLAIIPTVVGHSLYNWLLKYVSAHKVATTILGEPIGATILAIIFFDQIPGWWTVIGGILILGGIFIVLRKKKERPAL